MRIVEVRVSEEAWEALVQAASAKGCGVESLAKGIVETAAVRLRAAGAPFEAPERALVPPRRGAAGPK